MSCTSVLVIRQKPVTPFSVSEAHSQVSAWWVVWAETIVESKHSEKLVESKAAADWTQEPRRQRLEPLKAIPVSFVK